MATPRKNPEGIKTITVPLTPELQKLLEERRAYLQTQNPFSTVSQADAVRHAISQTNYKRETKKDEAPKTTRTKKTDKTEE